VANPSGWDVEMIDARAGVRPMRHVKRIVCGGILSSVSVALLMGGVQ